MSKIFTFGLATMMLLMNLVGPAQDGFAIDSAPQESISSEIDLTTEEPTGGDEVLVEPIQEPEPVDQEEEDEVTEAEELTPVTEPEQNAHAPPAEELPAADEGQLSVEEEPVGEDSAQVVDEEPVMDTEPPVLEDEPVVEEEAPVDAGETTVEDVDPVVIDEPVRDDGEQPEVDGTDAPDDTDNETMSESDDIVISPSAVNPDPGDCPIEDACDGGGGGDPEPDPDTVSVTIRVLYNGDEGSGVVPNAHIAIFGDDDSNMLVQTSESGTVQVTLDKSVSYIVTIATPGYQLLEQQPLPSNQNGTVEFTLVPASTGEKSISFKVVDLDTGAPLEDASIQIKRQSDGALVSSGATDANGLWTSPDLPIDTYFPVVELRGYHFNADHTFSIPSSGEIVEIKLQRFYGDRINLTVVDGTTGAPISGASVAIHGEDGGDVLTGFTSGTGEFTSSYVLYGVFKISVSADGYGSIIDYQWDHSYGNEPVIELFPFAEGSVTFAVLDIEGEAVSDAYVTVFPQGSSDEIAFGKTFVDGTWGSPTLPGGNYTASIYAAGFAPESVDFSVVGGHQIIEVNVYMVIDVGNLEVVVVDDGSQSPLADASITVRQRGIVAEGVTDANGMWVSPPLKSGDFNVIVAKEGYQTQVVEYHRSTSADSQLEIGLLELESFDLRLTLNMPTCSQCESFRVIGVPGLGIANGFSPILAQTQLETVPVAGATIQLLDPATQDVLFEATSRYDGAVEFLQIPGGSYILLITHPDIIDYSMTIELTEDASMTLVLDPADFMNPVEPDNPLEPGTPTDPENPAEPDDLLTPGVSEQPTESTDPADSSNAIDPETPSESGGNLDEGSTSTVHQDTSSGDGALGLPVANAERGYENVSMQSSSDVETDSTTDNSVSRLPETGVGNTASDSPLLVAMAVIGFGMLSLLGARRRIR